MRVGGAIGQRAASVVEPGATRVRSPASALLLGGAVVLFALVGLLVDAGRPTVFEGSSFRAFNALPSQVGPLFETVIWLGWFGSIFVVAVGLLAFRRAI